MKSTVKRVARIASDSNGAELNATVLHLSNGKRIYRSLSQIKNDLEGSGRLGGIDLDTITSVRDSRFVKACTALAGGEVEGDVSWHKAGDTYTVTENSRVITTPGTVGYGEFNVGDKATYEKDGHRVEGFLYLTPSFAQRTIEANSDATAAFNAQLMGLFGTSSASSDSDSVESYSDEIPSEILDEIENANSEAPAEDELPDPDADTEVPAKAAAPAKAK